MVYDGKRAVKYTRKQEVNVAEMTLKGDCIWYDEFIADGLMD